MIIVLDYTLSVCISSISGCILVHYYSRNENIPIIPTLTLSPDEEAIIVLRSGQPTKQVI